MSILGLDYGDARIGVAVSDELHLTSLPLRTIENSCLEEVLEELTDIVEKHDIEKIVVGLPLHMDGGRGERAEITEKFVDDLRENLHLPVILMDERLTSAEIEKVLLKADLSRAARKRKRDKLAASLILRKYLESID
ncbi:Holliday junction resolvase RuvX [Halarsenatibacter silvermanii]|uniref:Putative pre-16S rRNA nuclease n=1 Tax=Halarsenatibacter silvermanii TaxID=321763 RepID=A0A1G9K0Q1_9FIRM|nr:Holliday junction resolvase RuvX [Halarsenatibacter silvermanii]SDL43510.1 putative holliday junction resolvase [Halarsenatibacter silvermanii]